MRVFDTRFFDQPEWPLSPGLPALRRQLRGAGAGGPPELLGPIGALQEVDAICAGMLSGRGGPNAANRASLVKDLSTALSAVGPELRRAAGAPLTAFLRELSRLSRRLETPQGARVVRLATRSLLQRLASEQPVQAAWRDAIAAFADVNADAEICEHRLRCVAELAEHRGVDYAERVSTVQALIGGDRATVAAWVPTCESPDDEARLAICGSVLAQLPQRSEVVVWCVIDDAAIESGYLRLGPVQLFDASLFPTELGDGGSLASWTDEFDPLPEVRDADEAQQWFDHMRPAEHRLLARVRLPDTTRSHAQRRARDVLAAMIDVAKQDSSWVLLRGAVSWTEQTGWSGSTFMHPEDAADIERPPHPIFERTARNLLAFHEPFLERWLAGDPVVEEAVEDALWTVSVERAPGASQRVVLATRAIERTLSRARETPNDGWATAAERYLRAPWLRYTLNRELLDAAALAAFRLTDRWGANAELSARVNRAAFPSGDGGVFSARGFAGVVQETLDQFEPGSLEQRLVREAAQVLHDPPAALERIDALERRFDFLLARTERQRNALVHGSGSAQRSIESVERFAAELSRWVAQEAMRQAETSTEPLVELERTRLAALDDRARLEAGESPLDVLFPPPAI